MTERRTLLKAFAVLGMLPVGAWVWESWPLHTDLYSVAFESERAESVTLDVEIAVNGDQAYRTSVELAPAPDRVALPCEWGRPAWSYRVAVRLSGTDKRKSVHLRGEGRYCSVTKINPADAASETIDFEHTTPCPPERAETSSCA